MGGNKLVIKRVPVDKAAKCYFLKYFMLVVAIYFEWIGISEKKFKIVFSWQLSDLSSEVSLCFKLSKGKCDWTLNALSFPISLNVPPYKVKSPLSVSTVGLWYKWLSVRIQYKNAPKKFAMICDKAFDRNQEIVNLMARSEVSNSFSIQFWWGYVHSFTFSPIA